MYRKSNDFKTQQFKPQDLITSTDLRLTKSKVFTPSSQNFARTSRTTRQDSKGLNDLGNSNLSQKDELEQLSQQEQQARMQLELSEQKLAKLSNQLDAEYQLKIQEVDRLLTDKQEQYKEFVETTKQYQISDMIDELKSKISEQKQRASLDRLDLKKKAFQEREQSLFQLIQKEKKLQAEIQKKDLLIQKFKEFVDQQQQQKEVIVEENKKIKEQLAQIKDLFKNKLPQLGIDPNILEEDEQEEEEEPEDELPQQAQDPSTGDEQ
ncbi:hypothetical protein pb186bvf_016980 [Paramecium bursaria]